MNTQEYLDRGYKVEAVFKKKDWDELTVEERGNLLVEKLYPKIDRAHGKVLIEFTEGKKYVMFFVKATGAA